MLNIWNDKQTYVYTDIWAFMLILSTNETPIVLSNAIRQTNIRTWFRIQYDFNSFLINPGMKGSLWLSCRWTSCWNDYANGRICFDSLLRELLSTSEIIFMVGIFYLNVSDNMQHGIRITRWLCGEGNKFHTVKRAWRSMPATYFESWKNSLNVAILIWSILRDK